MADAVKPIEKGWPAIKKAPWHFIGAVITLTVLGWGAIHLHYTAVISAKDATIQTKEALIDSKQESLEAIQQTVAARDDLLFSVTNQWNQMQGFQQQLAKTQAGLLEQQKKLAAIEFYMEGFFSTLRTEVIPLTNGAHVFQRKIKAGTECFVLLDRAAIPKSVQVTVKDQGFSQLVPSVEEDPYVFKNLVVIALADDWDFTNATFTVRYAADSRETNLLKKVAFLGEKVLGDDLELPSIWSQRE